MVNEVPAYVLAALTAGGGITGYLRTGSLPSVIAGTAVGALYALGGYRIAVNRQYGIELALLASLVLAGSSIPRAIKTQKGLPIGLSLLALYGLFTYGAAFKNRL
ncbi:hypothetical protein V492_07672 [Pseudogymnoascus sp. VKM F-4246]|nr:hypothetical protein V492_07672 [Pseudogymnoascus sp. VKM F-4246]